MSVVDIHRRYAGHVSAAIHDHAAYDKLHNEGGFSHHLITGEEPHSGYMVGIHPSLGGDERVIPLKDLTPEHITQHRQDQRAIRPNGTYQGHPLYQGGWVHNGDAYLDHAMNVQDHDEAMELGKKHHQLAVWDVAHSREIPVGE